MVVRDMTDKKNKIWLCGILLLSITASIVLLKSPFFDITRFGDLAPDFHYNAISMSAVIAVANGDYGAKLHNTSESSSPVPLMPKAGIEPATRGFSVLCSTN